MNGPFATPRRRRAIVAALALALMVSACGDDTTSSGTGGGSTAGGADAEADLAAAQDEVERALEGDFTEAPSESNPAATGKNVWIIVSGLASPTAANSSRNFTTAAELLGWETNVYDAQLDPSNFPKGIEAALAANADGLITIGIDCPYIKPQLDAAREAGVQTVGLYSLDCNEIDPAEPQGYTSSIGFGDRFENLADAFRAWGADAASWIIANTDGNANVISMENSEYNILRFYQEGFNERMAQCGSCQVTIVPWLGADFGPGLTSKTQAALQSEPEANAVQANVNPTLGITQGIVASGRQADIYSVGGFGLQSDFDAIRNDQGLNAVVAIPDEWWSFAAADTLNSLFNGTEVRDSGTGWQLFDHESELPEEDFVAESDYVEVYKEAWGVG